MKAASLPQRVFQGKPASIAVTTAAPVGPAVASVSCGGSARISRRFAVGS
jgi:hypothetical protein